MNMLKDNRQENSHNYFVGIFLKEDIIFDQIQTMDLPASAYAPFYNAYLCII